MRMFPLSKSCTTVFVSSCPSGVDAAIATAGTATVHEGDRDDPAERDVRGRRSRIRSPSRRASVGTSSGIEAKRRRYAGQAGMSSRQNDVRLDRRPGGEALHDEEGREPASEQRRDRAAPHAEHGQEPGDRRPLREPRAPEELAQLAHLLPPVLEVEVEVAVELQGGDRRSRARCQSGLVERERRDLAEPAHLPEQEDEERRDDRGSAREPLAPAARHDVGEGDARDDEEVRRLERCGGADQEAGQDRVRDTARRERPDDEEHAARTTTIDGKSAIAVRPSACGRNCSLQRSW